MIAKADGILKNHIFTVEADDSNQIAIQEFDGAKVEKQLLVLKDHRDTDWKPSFVLETILPPGLPGIKWNELYKKWGKFVPEDKRKGLLYFMNELTEDVKRKISEQATKAKEARAMRSRARRLSSSTEPIEASVRKKRGRPKQE
jgi:hypothetical protein